MKAVILAAGKGKRMGNLTKELPKPMIQVQGKPLLEHILSGIRDQTPIRDFFIITGHCAEVIEEHFKDGESLGIHCSYGRQEIPDGTGKAPEIAQQWLGSAPFLLSYGDILIQPSEYAKMFQLFTETGKDGVLSVKRNEEEIQKGGAVLFDDHFILEQLIEKPEPGTVQTPWYNAGVYFFKPSLFDYTASLKKSSRGEYELTDAIQAMTDNGLQLIGHEIQGDWADVRDPEILEHLNRSPQKT